MKSLYGLWRVPVVAVAAAAGMLLVSGQATAGTVTVGDGSHVLSRTELSAVSTAAARLGADPVRIYTTTALANDNAAFDGYYARQMDGAAPATVLVGVNTRSRHLTIHSGKKSGFHAKDARAAAAAFNGGLRGGRGYAGALVALFRSLHASAGAGQAPTGTGTSAPAAPTGPVPSAEKAPGGGMSTGVIAAIAAAGVMGVAVLAIAFARLGGRRRRPAAAAADRRYGDW